MEVFDSVHAIGSRLELARIKGLSIGFVPTMGALHEGHLALIRKCREENDLTVCSIFVNPLQFNRPDDFKHYPVTAEQDAALLIDNLCDVLFRPDVKEMYPGEVSTKYDFGRLEQVMEGRFRPGHFNGVGVVVKRLFDIVQPGRAYFGEKDYQQLLVIRRLVEIHHLDIEIVACPIVRESDGLAMSSRNTRLAENERSVAPVIHRILSDAVKHSKDMEPGTLTEWVSARFNEYPLLSLEYFELSDAATLEPLSKWDTAKEAIACIAVFLGKVRLIDNIRFLPNFAE